MGFEKIIDDLTVKRIDALTKKIQSPVDYVSYYFICVHAILWKL